MGLMRGSAAMRDKIDSPMQPGRRAVAFAGERGRSMNARTILIVVVILVVLGAIAAFVSFGQGAGVQRDVTTPQSLETQSED